eukprot:Nk52_evm4s564 gene=Nk52_evmTU4s564
MTQKSVVFIFALCALCTLSGPFHGSAEPIPSHGEDKAVDVEMTDLSSKSSLGNPLDKGIALSGFYISSLKNGTRFRCAYGIMGIEDNPQPGISGCPISTPNSDVKCRVNLLKVSTGKCPEIWNKILKVKYRTRPKNSIGDPTIVGDIYLNNLEIDTFPRDFSAPIRYYRKPLRNVLKIDMHIGNDYDVLVDLFEGSLDSLIQKE